MQEKNNSGNPLICVVLIYLKLINSSTFWCVYVYTYIHIDTHPYISRNLEQEDLNYQERNLTCLLLVCLLSKVSLSRHSCSHH